MKKYLIALAALCGFTMQAKADTDLTALKNVVYVESATITQGLTQTISLNTKNEGDLAGFQCKIYLPEGLSFEGYTFTVAGERTEGKTFGLASSNIQADGSLMIVYGASNGDVIPAGEGQVAAITIQVPASIAVGDYKVQVKETVLRGLDNEVDVVESTLTVSDRITLDENATEAPAAAEGVNVKVLRTINANEWSTICLPFAMTEAQVTEAFGNDVQLADFTGAVTDDEGKVSVNFTSVSEMAANHPYIIKVAEDIKSFEADNVNIAADEEAAIVQADEKTEGSGRNKVTSYNEFIGNYVAGTELPLYMLFLNDNKFFFSTGATKIKAFRAYFNLYDAYDEALADYEAKAFINIDGKATGIAELQNNVKANGAIFNLAGQRVSKAQKGIFIQNGKKTVIK